MTRALPYAGDCVAQFLRDIETAPDLVCVHLAARPGLRGLRQMCAPQRAACLTCSVLALDRPCAGCNCCGASTEEAGQLTVVRFAVSRDNIVCGASLCQLCVSLIPAGVGVVVPVTGSAR